MWNDSLFFSDTNTLNGTWEQIIIDLSQLTITSEHLFPGFLPTLDNLLSLFPHLSPELSVKDFISSTTDEIKDLVKKEAPARVSALKRIFSKLFKR